MSARTVAFTTLAGLVVAALSLALSPADQPTRASGPRPALSAAPVAHETPLAHLSGGGPVADDGAQVRVVRYRLALDFSSTIGGGTGPSGHVEGIWTTRPLADDRVAVRLDEAVIQGYETLPPAEALAGGAELAFVPDGALVGLGFPARMSGPARNLYTAMATAFWLTPGEGDTWQADEEDAVGAWTATYTRRGAQITRRIDAWSALRGPAGLEPLRGRQVTSAGGTTFVFDDEGLAQVDLDTRTTISDADDALVVVTQVRGRLVRLDTRTDALTEGRLAIHPIGVVVDTLRDKDLIDDQLIGDADAAALLDELARIDGLDRDHPDTRKWRGLIQRRMAALVRQDPAVAAELAARIRRDPSAAGEASLILGALGGSGVAEGTNALADLLDADLPSSVERSVLNHLTLADTKTPEAADALREALKGEQGDAAAAALGAQARDLADAHPEVVEDHIDALIARYYATTTPAERLAALQALGNSGSPRILPIVSGLLVADDPVIATEAVFALRFIPGDEVDALLLSVLARGQVQATAAAAACAYRDADLWRVRLTAALEQHAGNERLVAALRAALAQLD